MYLYVPISNANSQDLAKRQTSTELKVDFLLSLSKKQKQKPNNYGQVCASPAVSGASEQMPPSDDWVWPLRLAGLASINRCVINRLRSLCRGACVVVVDIGAALTPTVSRAG